MYNFNNFHPSTDSTPNHVGIIPDGTRRWSRKNNIKLVDGYKHAMHKLFKIINFIFDKGTSNISIYLASTQNFRRPNSEIEAFCIAENFLIEKILMENLSTSIKVKVLGEKEYFPEYLKESVNNIESRVTSNTEKKLFLCLAYNPFEEVYRALKRCNFNKDFLNYLDANIPLDLIIRTSDANLLSNFMLLQSGFARLYNIDKLFNETELSDYDLIIKTFSEIDRKYGN